MDLDRNALDRWITREPEYWAGEEALDAAWENFATEHGIDYDACEEEHVDHNVFEAWVTLALAMQERQDRRDEEQIEAGLAAAEAAEASGLYDQPTEGERFEHYANEVEADSSSWMGPESY